MNWTVWVLGLWCLIPLCKRRLHWCQATGGLVGRHGTTTGGFQHWCSPPRQVQGRLQQQRPWPPLPWLPSPPYSHPPHPAHTISQSPRLDRFSRDPGYWALGAFSNRDPLPLPRQPPLSRSEPLSSGGRGGGSGGGMADANKAEVPGATGGDSPHLQPAEPPGEQRREPHPPEAEKQQPQHSSSSNGVKMYCLFLREPGRGGGRGVGRGARGQSGPWWGITTPRPRPAPGPSAAWGAGAAGPLPGPSPPAPGLAACGPGSGGWGPGDQSSSLISSPRQRTPLFPDFG